ncbi:hypothetical protein L0244_26110 [bacterium]|nr:hypothetical protein [bacterium]MCI0616470.1 hypothetical protein [bacterium]
MSDFSKIGKSQQTGSTPQVQQDSTPTSQPAKPQDQPSAATPMSEQNKAQQKGMVNFEGDIKKSQIQGMTDVKKMTEEATKSKLDGAVGISKSEYDAIKKSYQSNPQNSESVKWMEKNHPHLHAAITSDLDYSGYTGTAVGSLNLTRAGDELKQDAARREQSLNKLPNVKDYGPNGLPKNMPPGDPVVSPEAGEKWKEYKAGTNTMFIKDGSKLENISDADAQKARQSQKDYCAKMSGIIGTDVPNPPSVNASKNYFQQLANRGATPEQIKNEYGEYMKTFYQHPGGVKWDPKLDPKNLDKNFAQQPIGKDGKRLIDCEGYSAMTEDILGGIKKDGKPMFDIMHGAGGGHVITGVYPHGGDPRKGFIVSNDQVISDIKWDPAQDKNYAKGSPQRKQEFVVKNYWEKEFGGTTNKYRSEYANMDAPPGKIPKQ